MDPLAPDSAVVMSDSEWLNTFSCRAGMLIDKIRAPNRSFLLLALTPEEESTVVEAREMLRVERATCYDFTNGLRPNLILATPLAGRWCAYKVTMEDFAVVDAIQTLSMTKVTIRLHVRFSLRLSRRTAISWWETRRRRSLRLRLPICCVS